MRATVALLTTLLLLPAAAQPVPPTEVRFGSPAQAAGHLHASYSGHLLVLAPPTPQAAITVEVRSDLEGTLSNRTEPYAYLRTSQGGGFVPPPSHEQTSPLAIPKGTRFTLSRAGGGSIFLEADQVEVEGDTPEARLLPAPDNGDLAALLPRERGEANQHHGIYVAPSDAVLLLGPARNTTVRFTATGLHSLAWTNANVTCPTPPCPTGGEWTSQETTLAGATVRTGAAYYETFISSGGGDLEGGGTVGDALLASSQATYAVNGTLRLPAASADLGCPACLSANHTLVAAGLLTLDRTRRDGDGMAASLGGQVQAARLDEVPLDLSLLGDSVLGVTAAATLAVGLNLLLALFTKLKQDPLQHPRRRSIYDYVQAHPGATFREVSRAVGVASGTTRHHLLVLRRNGLVMERPHGSTVRFFERDDRFTATWSAIVLLREEPLRRLHDWIAAHPGAAQRDVLEGMAESAGWSRSTTQHRLERLVAGGVVEQRVQGRRRLYRVPGLEPAQSPIVVP